jgi:hypothetical protein
VPGQRRRSFLSDEEWLILFESLRLSPREAQVAQAVFDDESEVAIARGAPADETAGQTRADVNRRWSDDLGDLSGPAAMQDLQ